MRRKVDLGALQGQPADFPAIWSLSMSGFAMSKISERGALDQTQTLRILGEDEQAMQGGARHGLDGLDDRKPS